MFSTYFHPSVLATTLFSLALTTTAFASENNSTPHQIITTENHQTTNNMSQSNSEESYWGKFKRNINQTWDNDQYNYYLPVWTWHNRFTYDKEKRIAITKRLGVLVWGNIVMTMMVIGTLFMRWHLWTQITEYNLL